MTLCVILLHATRPTMRLLLVLSILFSSAGSWATPSTEIPTWRGTDLSDIRNSHFLGSQQTGRVVKISLRVAGIGEPIATRACGAAVILIRGIRGTMGQFRVVSERLRTLPIEQYFFAYNDNRSLLSSSRELAEQIRLLRSQQDDRSCQLTVVAHGAAGVMARAALNQLSAIPVSAIGAVTLMAVDSPWHGLGVDRTRPVRRFLSRPVLSEAQLDLGASSRFMEQLFLRGLPSHLQYWAYFASSGTDTSDYLETPISSVVDLILYHFNGGTDPRPGLSAGVTNFWAALRQSAQFASFDRRARELKAARNLNEQTLLVLLEDTFPHFHGSHRGMLDSEWQFAEYLTYRVSAALEADLDR